MLLVGAGLGAAAGAAVGVVVLIPAVVAVVAGIVLLVLRGTEPPRTDQLGSRVETILRLAEQQAADHIAEANATAARIIAEAGRAEPA